MRQRLKENAEEKLEFDKDNKELISNISHDLKDTDYSHQGICGGNYGWRGKYAGKDGQIYPHNL